MRGGALRAVAAFALLLAMASPVFARKFDVGGHSLRAIRKGHGAPTVVFDAGMGDSLDSWRWVWPEVAKVTSVVLYDRAGLGKSDDGPLPRTSERIVEELDALLRAARVEGPLVLVGHSFGGMNARMYAATHPDRVVGLVLLDATPLDFPAREASLRDPIENLKVETLMQLTSDGPRHEREAVLESAEQVRRAPPLAAGLRVIVLSSGRPDERPRFREAWLALQRDLAAEIGADEHEVVAESGHYLQYDEPERVVEAIVRTVEEIRRTLARESPAVKAGDRPPATSRPGTFRDPP